MSDLDEARAIALNEARVLVRRACPLLLSHGPSLDFLASLALTQPDPAERADLLGRAAEYAFILMPRRQREAQSRYDQRLRAVRMKV